MSAANRSGTGLSAPPVGARPAWCWPVVAALLVAGCGEDGAGYFPLQEGLSWGYRVTVETQGTGRRTYRSYVANLPRQALDAEQATPRLFHDGRIHYYAERPDGILLVAAQEPGEAPAPAPPGLYVLRYPLELGTEWSHADRTYLRKERVVFDVMAPAAIEVDMSSAIVSLDSAVTVPAGTFRNCVQVRGRGKTTVDLGSGYVAYTVTIDSREWFAPGVGLVKMVRRESSEPPTPGDSTMVKELEVFKDGSWFD